MDSAVGDGALAASSGRVLSSKQRAPPPPQKVIKCDPVDVEIQEDDIPKTLSTTHRKALQKQSQDQAKEPQALVFRKLDDQDQDQGGGLKGKPTKEQKVSLAHTGEKLLATFYGMLYTNDGAEKEWKLEVDGFLPICFVQVQGNANKPFRIIAVEKSKRIMEYRVNVNTTCARNSTFVKWQDGVSMFGIRFAKEDQAEQFLNTVKRMASTLNKAALLLKQPERKAIIRQMSDPDSTSNVQHTKVSLMIKLPDKQSTVMSVPGLLTMSELFEMICEKENLIPAEHQLSLPRTGARKVTFDSGTAIGSLKIREVAIIRTVMTSETSAGGIEVEDESVEDLLDTEGEENKILQLILPNGVKKSYRVSLDMTMKQLVMRVCSREGLNPRHHSLQYIDFKHEFLEADSTVDEIGISQVRLMDKRVLKRNSLTIIKSSVTDDDSVSPSNSPHNRKHRKSCGDELDSDSSATSEGDKENKMSWQQRSKSLEVLADEKQNKALPQQNGHMTKKDSQKHSASNGSVPITERRNSSEATTIKKPPIPPLPYASKYASLKQNQPGNLTNGALRDQNLSPIKKNGLMSASTPDLSTISSRSDSPDIKTSTPDTKSRRRAAPPPPPRPAAPKALFTDVKSDTQVDGAGLGMKTNNLPPVASSLASQAPAVGEVKLKPSHKKRPAPPRPDRPPPPQPAPRLAKQSSQENKDVNGAGREKEVSVQLKQDKEARNSDRASLSLDLETRPHSVSPDEEAEEDELSDLRGIPIFIPPPPPDELPPPLDECETPVGPLTDFEADILEGSVNDDFPGTLNGYVGMQNIGMFAVRGTGDSQAQTVLKSRQETALESVPEQGYLPDGKDLFPVVPPPPLYSEPESSGLTDIPPPLLETQTIETSQEGEEKEHDSGFDQSPEHLTVTPPEDLSDDVQVERWEDPDTGSSLDVISAIPPPADFETRPLTPPCQFANPTVVSPGFFNSVEGDKKEEKPVKEKSRKKLNISEGLFPWMNEPQAPVNAVISLDESKDPENDMIVRINTGDTPPASENRKDSTETVGQPTSPSVDVPSASIATDVYSRPAPHEDEKPARPELKVKQNVVLGIPEVSAEVKPSVESQRSSCGDQIKESALQNPKITESSEIGANKIIVTNENSKESASQQALDTNVKPAKPETTAEPVAFVQETEVKVEPEVDVKLCALSSLTPSTEAARPEPQVKPAKLDLQVKPEKPETKAKPVAVVREAEVKVEQLPSSSVNPPLRPEPLLEPAILEILEKQVKPDKPDRIIIPATVIKEPEVQVDIQQPSPSEAAGTQPLVEPLKPEQQVKPEKPETTVKPVPFVKEAVVKVDVQSPALSSFNPSTEAARLVPQVLPGKPEQPVKPVIQENLKIRPVEEVITPQSKPKLEMCVKTLSEEHHDLLVEEAPITIVTVGKQDIVAEAPVTPETKPISCADDKLKDLEAKLQELDNYPVPSSSELKKLESKTAPVVYKEVEPAVQTKDLFSEEVIVTETKQVEFSSYEHFEKLFKMDTEETHTKEDTRVQHKEDKADVIMERQHFQPESSSSHVEEKSELSLDLSSLRQSPEPPRPPSSSPPAASPRSSSLPSPVALDSARSTDSGFATLEKPKNPSSLDSKTSAPTSLSNSVNRTTAETKVSITAGVSSGQKESKPPASQTEEQGDTNTIQTASIPAKPPTAKRPNVKLQRPLSMPAGILRDFKSHAVQDKSKSAESDLRESDTGQEKSKSAKSDSRASSSSDSSGISSSSPASSPVEMSATETVDMPKPPPFTVPPLRRYSDLAADLSFISSAAKAAEKANESESKADVPPKPPNVLLRRNPGTAPVERPRSWVGPETETKHRPRMWSSAFKPVSFDAQGKKGVRPVDFQVKSFAAPPAVPSKPTAPSAAHSTASVYNEAPVTETLGTKQPDNSTQKDVEKSSKQAPLVPGKPSVVSTGKSAAPVVSLSAREEESSSNQPVKSDSKVERTPSNPLTKKTDPGETKYEIIYSNTSSTSQGASKAQSDKTDGGSHSFSKHMANPAALRDQILRDQSRAQNKVTRGRPQSAIVSGSKFQILPANEKSPSNSGMPSADAKKPATIQPKGVSWTHSKQQTNDHSSKPDVLPPQPSAKPLPPVKPAVADSKPLPAVVMRTKTEQHDPTKRHSLPTYIIEEADRKQPVKTTSNKEGNFNFIMEEVQTDTTVVPRGVVAAMKALREKKGTMEDTKEGVVDLEHTEWV